MQELFKTTPKQPLPTWKQALLIFLGGIVLGISSCAAFLDTALKEGKEGILTWIFEVGFFIGGGATVVGFVLILICLFVGSKAEIAAGKADQLRKPGESNE